MLSGMKDRTAPQIQRTRPYFRQVAGQRVLGSVMGIIMNTAVVLPAILLGHIVPRYQLRPPGKDPGGAHVVLDLLGFSYPSSGIHPLPDPTPAHPKLLGYLCNGLAAAVSCPWTASQTALKSTFSPGRPPDWRGMDTP